MSVRSRFWSVARAPALHFTILGALVFGAQKLIAAHTPETTKAPERSEVVITAAQIRSMVEDFTREASRAPTQEEREALVNQAIDDELLYREAVFLGLDRNDKSVRARLIEKMRAISDDPSLDEEHLYRAAIAAGLEDDVVIKRILREDMRVLLRADAKGGAPTDEELNTYLEKHAGEYLSPETITFDHVFLRTKEDRNAGEREAQNVRAKLVRERISPRASASLSDPFPLGLSAPARPLAAVARQFGPGFIEKLNDTEPGTWSQPIRSVYGTHLVYVRARTKAAVPPLAALRQKLIVGLLADRSAVQLHEALGRLRELYTVRVEDDV